MDPQVWLSFAVASAIVIAVPGPTVLLVLSYAMARGRRVATSVAAGVALGDLVAMSASLAGLGALVLASATLFTVLKWLGAAYLLWVGIQMIRNAATPQDFQHGGERSAFRHAAIVTALNPKSIAFFIAFVPHFVQPDRPLLPQFAILVATFVTLGALNAMAYAVFAGAMRARLARPALRAWLARIGGGTLAAMGVATATLRAS